jgi:hypothetical protein
MAYEVDSEFFDYRVKVTIDKDQVDSTLSNFTASVQVSDLPTGFVDIARSTGGDFRITSSDGTTRRALSVENFNQGAYTGVLVFNVASVSSSVDTDVYVYAGNSSATQPAASHAYGSENATNSNVTMRLTLDEDPSGAGEVLLDTTGNTNHGDPFNMEAGDSISAKVNNGLAADGVDEYVRVDDAATIDFAYNEDFSVEMAFRIPSTNQPDTSQVTNELIGKWDTFTGTPYNITFFNHTHGTPAERYLIRAFRYDGTNQPILWSANTYNDDTWHHLTFWKSGGTLYLKIDGETLVSGSDTTTGTTTNAADMTLFLAVAQGAYLKADLDEVLIHDTGVGEAHAKARAVNILTPNTFYTIGELEKAFIPKVMFM